MAPAAGSGSLGFQPYGTGNFVVTRPGTLLFPPLQAPTSTLIPGFAGAGDSHTANHAARTQAFDNARSEEHTSELQSLMRISYAVFCLKKKTHIAHTHET